VSNGQVDGGEFLDAYSTDDAIGQRPDLGIAVPEDPQELAQYQMQQQMREAEGSAQRAVVDLLVEQVRYYY
jgi:hypothetical protein